MKNFISVTSLVLVLVFLGSCRAVKSSRETVRTVKDSTFTEVTYKKRDTTIIIPGDTLKVKVPITEITKEPVTRTNGRNTVIIRREGNDLDIECLNEEMEQRFELLEKWIKENKTKTVQVQTTTEIPVRYIPGFVKTLAWIGGIALALGGVLLFVKFKPF